MLDTFLAIVLLFAVILFGALMVAGNERQYKAISKLHDAHNRWAEGDLKLKRAEAAKSVRVEDPKKWLEAVTTRLLGEAPRIANLLPWETGSANAIIAECEGGRRLIITPTHPETFRKAVAVKKGGSRAAQALAGTTVSTLGKRPAKTPVYELNVVTSNLFFDIEAEQAWQLIFKKHLGTERLFMFDVAADEVH